MDITRNDIEDEENYKKLQAIGRAYRKEGHKLVLNAPEDELKQRLLVIFDEHYSKEQRDDPPDDVTDVVDEVVADVVADVEPEPDAVDPKENLYIAPRFYKDWASGWTFTPGMDEPKALPDTLTPGLKNALKAGKIIPYEG